MQNIDAVFAVERMQNYISEHLTEEIKLVDLACEAGYSPWHASRIFKELTGKSPFEYIRDMRLTQAAKSLRNGNKKIVDTAYDYVFGSHEGFTRSFFKEFGITPSEYKYNPIPIKYFIPYSVLSHYYYYSKKEGEQYMEKKQVKTVFVQLTERPLRKAIIKRGVKAEDYFAYCEEVGCEIWGFLESVTQAIFEPAGYWLPEKLIKAGTSKYVQGVEVPFSYNSVVPEGFELIELEPCNYLIFKGEPFKDEDFEEAISEIWQQIEKYDPKLLGYRYAYDTAPSFQLAPLGERGYIEGHPVTATQK
ncbi:AraC family transcriptional regulator [bacterium]|nr:AraC family transcriptional regulator [bacterium]